MLYVVTLITGAPKLISSDLFVEKSATVHVCKIARCARTELRFGVSILKRGRYLHKL